MKKKILFFIKVFTDPETLTVSLCYMTAYFYKYGTAGKILGKIIWRINVFQSGCYIDPEAQISKNLMMPHPVGIVIGKNVVIGSNLKIHQNVSLSSLTNDRDTKNNNKVLNIGNNVIIYAGAVVVGSLKIGDNVTIGANALVISDVPNNTIVISSPAIELKKE